MENKLSYIVIVFIIFLFLIGSYKVYDNHIDKLYLVVNNKIREEARRCYLDGNCSGKITLKELIDKEYIDIVIDPVTKEEMDDSLCIKYEDDEVIFCE